MSSLGHYKDAGKMGCYSNVTMDNGDPCFISIARNQVLIKKSRMGIFGKKILDSENDPRDVLDLSAALEKKFPEHLTPPDIVHTILRAFTNAALHCSSLDELEGVLRDL